LARLGSLSPFLSVFTKMAPARDRPDPGMEGSEEALAHETATTEVIAEAAK
jgi:hypothetical protein